jgi:isoamylase
MSERGIGNGKPYPLGATPTENGVNFSIFSAHAQNMYLLLFDSEDAEKASRVITLDPETNRTGHYWHVHVDGVFSGQVYAYRAEGPYEPERGYRFDPSKVLLDPYGKAISVSRYRRPAAVGRGDNNEAHSMRSVVADLKRYDWQGDRPLLLSFRTTVIYELHVGGFTRNPNSGVREEKRGTYAGLIEKIPYLQELGVTAVELMPVSQFDWQDAPPGLENYWGYSPVSFFAPHLGYSSRQSPLQCLDEFRDMVKAFHRAKIEVILDVVYNHTAEAGADGPTLCLRGLDNSMYYTLSPHGRYLDFTGTGHTLNSNHSVVRRLIIDSLRYWVSEMHVDGFRFDLASVLSRDEKGLPVEKAPVVWDIDSDPLLSGAKLIAEAWDAAGLYQVGSFSIYRWKEWNGRFRDDMRSFLKSDRGTVSNLTHRLMGSPDVYEPGSHPPEQSINFVTCHDGFTMNDLVSYDEKHNESNREGNRDGAWSNLAWNCGCEGPTDNPEIEALRERQIRNAHALNLLSIGVPLVLMGDECRRTQRGNNNAYCQNNSLSWFDWSLCQKNAGLRRFVSLLIRLRRQAPVTHRYSLTLREFLEQAEIDWHGVQLFKPDLSQDSHTIAATLYMKGGPSAHVMFNAFWEPLRFAVPPKPENAASWFRVIDTFQPSPRDILDVPTDVIQDEYLVQPRSIVMLTSLTEDDIKSILATGSQRYWRSPSYQTDAPHQGSRKS